MKRVIRCIRDTYITDRIIDNAFRATDTNVGRAGTIDIFKLAGESKLGTGEGPFVSGTDEPIELSRALLRFDLDPIRALTSSILDLASPSFRVMLELSDVLGGQPTPSNFTLVVYPLSQSFDEGIGRDVVGFEDLDATNFITASVSSGIATLWFQSGANALGFAGQASIDVITGSGALDLSASQLFEEGDEDLSMDITTIVSATLAGIIPDLGLRLSFLPTEETDGRTRFVKRFASRHSTDTRLRPRLVMGFDDSVQDYHSSFFFDSSGSLFLNSFRQGVPDNIVSGTALIPVTGPGSLLLSLTTGSVASGTFFSKVITGSQHTFGGIPALGVYSASFAISSFESPALLAEIQSAASATFTETWGSLDGTVGYFTGTFVMLAPDRSAFVHAPDNLKVNILNLQRTYTGIEEPRLRVFVQDNGFGFRYTKVPIESKSLVFDRMYWRLRDAMSGDVIFDFDTASTRLSTDTDGMYFDAFMSDLDVGRAYQFDVMFDHRGTQRVFEAVGGSFTVEP